MSDRLVICITGMPGSGKSTVAQMLEGKGFTVMELSMPLKLLMRMCGVKLNVQNQEDFRGKLKEAFGTDILAKLLANKILSSHSNVVISGVRNMAELAYVRSLGINVAVIAVSVPKKLRYERLTRRKGTFRITSYPEFALRDRKNVSLGTPQVIRAADYVLVNTGTMKQLHSDLDELIKMIRNGGRKSASS